jgi:hypothetical protein
MVDIVVHSPGKVRGGWIVLAIAMLLGIITLAAARSIRIECSNVYVTTDEGRVATTDDGRFGTTDQRSCRVVL